MKSVLFLLHDGFPLNSLASMTDVLQVAGWLSGKARYRWRYAATKGERATAYNGTEIAAQPLSAMDPAGWDAVAVLASFDPQALVRDEAALGFLREAHRHGATLAGVETGGIALAAAGLLEGGVAAVHWANRAGFSELFPGVLLLSEEIAYHRRCITCVGGVASLDLALHLVEQDLGAALALEVAEHLCNAGRFLETRDRLRRAAGAGAGATGGGRLLDRAIRLMNDTIEEPVEAGEVAARLGVSQRRLERAFRRQLGLTPAAHYRALRLTRAQNLLQQTGLSVQEVAAATGYNALATFSRAYKRRFGVAPSADRKQLLTASVPRLFIDRKRLEEDGDAERRSDGDPLIPSI